MTSLETIDVIATDDSTRPSPLAAASQVAVLVRRRLWRDRAMFLASSLVVAAATLLAYAGPTQVFATLDDGVADTVRAGGESDLNLTFPVGNPAGDNVQSVRGLDPGDLATADTQIASNLPPALTAIAGEPYAWVDSPSHLITRVTSAAEREAAAEAAEGDAADQPGEGRTGQYLTIASAPDQGVTVVAGTAPGPPEVVESGPGAVEVELAPVDVTMTQAVADALDIEVGDQLHLARATGQQVDVIVSAIVSIDDPEAPVWSDLPAALATTTTGEGRSQVTQGALLVEPQALEAITSRTSTAFTATVTIPVDAETLSRDDARALPSAIGDAAADPAALLPGGGVNPRLETTLDEALADYPARARAALAQMSLLIAGVVAVAAVVIALMARLLLHRRVGDIALERARGGSVLATAGGLLAEAAMWTAAGVAGGYYGARALVGDVEPSHGLAAAVAVVSLGAAPTLAALTARRLWAGKREPANRADRAKLRKARAARRLTLEALAVILGVLAVVTLRGRGVLQNTTEGIDPFLAAAPVLMALAAVVIVIRLYPLPMLLVQAVARRTRGVAGVLTLAKARQAIPVLPLLALTLAVSVAVAGGLMVATVSRGQEAASWERIGAEARTDTVLTGAQEEQIEAAGPTVSRILYAPFTTIALGSAYQQATLLAIDEDYLATLEAAGVEDLAALRSLLDASAGVGAGDEVPALASPDIVELDLFDRSTAYVGRTHTPIDILGEADALPLGWSEAPYVVVARDAVLVQELSEEVEPNLALVVGPGAADALVDAGVEADAVSTRAQWLEARRDNALVGGVERALTLAVIAVAVLAAVALLVSVLHGVRERGRELSMLRTQGMGSGYGWWLALAEMLPLTVAAAVGGVAAGVAILVLLGGSLGLAVLSGGIGEPPLDIDLVFLAITGAGLAALLLFAVAAEVLAHRRNKLSEVLRYGQTR